MSYPFVMAGRIWLEHFVCVARITLYCLAVFVIVLLSLLHKTVHEMYGHETWHSIEDRLSRNLCHVFIS